MALIADPDAILEVCTAQLGGLDEDLIEYIAGVIETSEGEDLDEINEATHNILFLEIAALFHFLLLADDRLFSFVVGSPRGRGGS